MPYNIHFFLCTLKKCTALHYSLGHLVYKYFNLSRNLAFLKRILIGNFYTGNNSYILQKAFKNSIKQMHYINVSSYVEALINLIKQVVKAKIANRVSDTMFHFFSFSKSNICHNVSSLRSRYLLIKALRI